MSKTEHAVGAEPPAQFEDPVRGRIKRAVPDLRAQIVKRGMDRADLGFGARDKFLDAAILCRVEQGAAGRAARRLDLGDHPAKARLVRTPGEHRVIAACGKARGGIASDPCASADDEEHGLAGIGHWRGSPLPPHWRTARAAARG